MSVETIQILSTASFILAGVLLGTSIILFFALRIQDAFGFLTGRTRKKAIERIRENNEHSRENVTVSKRKDKVTSKIATSSLPNNQTYSNETVLLSQEQSSNTETTLLSQDNGIETTLLPQGNSTETTLLSQAQGNSTETTLLSQAQSNNTEAALFAQNNQLENQDSTIGVTTNLLNLNVDNSKLGIEYEIVFMESTEIIS